MAEFEFHDITIKEGTFDAQTREAIDRLAVEWREGCSVAWNRYLEDKELLQAINQPVVEPLAKLLMEQGATIDPELLRHYLNKGSQKEPTTRQEERPPAGRDDVPPYGSLRQELDQYTVHQYEIHNAPFLSPTPWSAKRTTMAAWADPKTPDEMGQGQIGGNCGAVVPGGEGYIKSGLGVLVTAVPKTSFLRVQFNAVVSYWLATVGSLGYASAFSKFTLGVKDVASGTILLQVINPFRTVVAMVWAGNASKGNVRYSMMDSVSVKPGKQYLVFFECEQWAGCGGLIVGAHNVMDVDVHSCEIIHGS